MLKVVSRDTGLVVGWAHCIHFGAGDPKSSALTQSDSSHSQKAVHNRITCMGYSKGNQKFSYRVLYFKCFFFFSFLPGTEERDQQWFLLLAALFHNHCRSLSCLNGAVTLVMCTCIPGVVQSPQSLISNKYIHLHLHLCVTS